MAICQRHPTLSSYNVHARFGQEAPSPRTILRVRTRNGLTHLSKRAPSTRPACRLTPEAMQRADELLHEKPHLGPERIAWDLQNGEHLTISPATIKRLKRKIHEAKYPPPPPPVWRFYERHHPHSLWHGDFLEKVTLWINQCSQSGI
ncbi:MAG: helix-turn-helix domain-containing protein [Candidatus Entotheonellia bacterium]